MAIIYELLCEVSTIANVLKSFGLKKSHTLSFYLPMPWQAFFLACTHIGAIHSVVYASCSSESLHDCIQDCSSHVVITSDKGRRGGKPITMKVIVDAALECPIVEHVLILKGMGGHSG